jgi:hypothetical protein
MFEETKEIYITFIDDWMDNIDIDTLDRLDKSKNMWVRCTTATITVGLLLWVFYWTYYTTIEQQ